jgi:hypothetical protein
MFWRSALAMRCESPTSELSALTASDGSATTKIANRDVKDSFTLRATAFYQAFRTTAYMLIGDHNPLSKSLTLPKSNSLGHDV